MTECHVALPFCFLLFVPLLLRRFSHRLCAVGSVSSLTVKLMNLFLVYFSLHRAWLRGCAALALAGRLAECPMLLWFVGSNLEAAVFVVNKVTVSPHSKKRLGVSFMFYDVYNCEQCYE